MGKNKRGGKAKKNLNEGPKPNSGENVEGRKTQEPFPASTSATGETSKPHSSNAQCGVRVLPNKSVKDGGQKSYNRGEGQHRPESSVGDVNHQRNQPQTSAWGNPQRKSFWDNKPTQQQQQQTSQQKAETSRPQQVVKKRVEESGSSDKVICVPEKTFTPGTLGRPIQLLTNHFELFLGDVKTVILYDVAFEPDRPKRLLKEAYRQFREAHFKNRNPAFDGRKYVYSVKDLPFGHSISDTVTVTTDVTKPMDFKVTMTKVKEVDLEPLKKFTQNRSGRIELTMSSIQALDIILGHTLWMENIKVGASYFSKPERPFNLGGGMVLYRGSFQSVSLGSKLFLNVDVANKAFPKDQKVINLIGELSRNVNFNQPLYDRSLQALNKYICNLKIEFKIPNKPSSKRYYTVNGVHTPASSTVFNYESQQVTVEKYFKMVHLTTLEYPQMPCLWVGPKNKTIYLPCELCKILPNQVVPNKLDPFQTSKMIKSCATNATVRKDAIYDCLRKADYNNDPVVNEFDLHVSNDFKRLDGRVLTPPELQYGNGNIKVSGGAWKAKQFIKPARIDSFTILSLDYNVNKRHMEDLAQVLIRQSGMVGMNLGQPVRPFEEIRLNELMKKLEKNKHVRIVFVIVSDGFVYKKVKQQAEQAVGCLTQCLTKATVLDKLNSTTVNNILLKVNAKCGGINHVLLKPPPKMNEPMMIMGADVTHPSPHSAEPSVAAVIASHDLAGSKYNLSCRIQRPTLEIINDLENMTREHILYFRKETGRLPVRIVFYRDGVSMGQFNIVLSSEFQAIRRACNKIQENYNPSITLIVVQKRHHTRLFPVNGADSEDRNGNVPAGTCVDTDIVLPNYQNFYLVSHASIQGVARPTKYVTLSDDNNFSNDELQSLTYYLCHMYTRCTRSVSYPAPTYYAHLAALRGKAYIDLLRFDLNNLEREQRKFQIKEEIIKGLPMFFV